MRVDVLRITFPLLDPRDTFDGAADDIQDREQRRQLLDALIIAG